jgi:hypothetical protein
MSVIDITFPGNLAQVASAPNLRLVPSTSIVDSALFVVSDLKAVFIYDAASLDADDGVTIIKPSDLTVLQTGRWTVALSQGLAETATEQAGIATAQAGIATQQAGLSGQRATEAAGQAGIALSAAALAEAAEFSATTQATSAASSAAIASTAAISLDAIQFNPATPTVPPAGVASGKVYYVVDANPATKLTSYLNTSGTGAPTSTPVVVPLFPSLASITAQLSETVYDTYGTPNPATGGASTGVRWVFRNTTAAHQVLVSQLILHATATGPQKLELSYPPSSGIVHTQATADVTVTPPTTGLQTLVAPTHFTAFTMPAGSQLGQFGNWVGYISGPNPDAVLCGGVDADTSYSETSAPSNVTFQIQAIGSRSQPIPLESRLDDLDDATTYQEETQTTVGASNGAPGTAATAPSAALWTMSAAMPVTAPIDQVFIDAKSTGTMKLRLMRSGSQIGSDHSYPIVATGPQTVPVSIPDARVGDKLRFTGITFGYTTPSAGDDSATDELSFPTYGFRLGYRQTGINDVPIKTKVAAIAAGGSDLSNKAAFFGNSLFEYPQNPSKSVSAQIATLLGITTYNGGVSGQTMPQIEARFNAAPDKWGWITVFEAYNGFNSPDADLPALARMVAKLTPSRTKRFLVLSCWNGDTQPVGSAGYNQIALLNKRRQAAYPYNYVDWRTHIIQNGLNDAGITPTSGDLTDIANDVIPRSLRLSGDFLHGNDAAYGVAARLLENVIRSNHWLSP